MFRRCQFPLGVALSLTCGLVTAQEVIPLPPGDPMAAQSRTRSAVQSPQATPAAPKRPSWRLDGTWQRGEQQLAVINGETLAVGGRIAGARVAAIEPGAVTLLYQGQTVVLRDSVRAANAPLLTPHGANP